MSEEVVSLIVQILETLLTRMGCRCVCVEDGSQALASTMGSIREWCRRSP